MAEVFYLNLGTIVLTFGSKYKVNCEKIKLKSLIKLTYILSILNIIVCTGISLLMLWLFQDKIFESQEWFIWISILIFASSFHLIDYNNKGILRLFDCFKLSCILDLIVTIINISLTILILKFVSLDLQSALLSLIIGLILSSLLSTIISVIILSKKLPDLWSTSIIILRNDFSIIFKTMFVNSFSLSLRRLSRKVDVLILASLAPASSVGIYDVGKKLSAMILLLRDAMSLAAFPQVSKAIIKGQYQKMYYLLTRFLLLFIPATLCCLFFIWLLSDILIVIIFGEEFREASYILTILSVTSFTYLAFFWSGPILLQLALLKTQLFSNLISLLIIIGLSYWLGGKYDGIGVAWAMVIGTLFQFMIVFIAIRKKLKSYDA